MANIFFLEHELGKKISLESKVMHYLIPYSCRVYNIHNVKTGSSITPLERIRGSTGYKVPKTLPFGILTMAKPIESAEAHNLERLSPILYLGPQHNAGGGMLGILVGDGRIGVEDPGKVRSYQGGRVFVPGKFPLTELLELCIVGEEGPSLSGPKPTVKPTGTDDDATGDGKPEEMGPPRVPSSGPPKSWVVAHGPIPGCTACKGIQDTGKSHGKVHSRACKHRLESQTRGRSGDGGAVSGSIDSGTKCS